MSDSIADTSMNEVSTGETSSEPQGSGQETVDTTGSSWLDKLMADAPPDDGTYRDHALNYDKSESTAKIIRGFEGFLGNLDKAVVLIGIGVVQKYQEAMTDGEKDDETVEKDDDEAFGVLEGEQA